MIRKLILALLCWWEEFERSMTVIRGIQGFSIVTYDQEINKRERGEQIRMTWGKSCSPIEMSMKGMEISASNTFIQLLHHLLVFFKIVLCVDYWEKRDYNKKEDGENIRLLNILADKSTFLTGLFWVSIAREVEVKKEKGEILWVIKWVDKATITMPTTMYTGVK